MKFTFLRRSSAAVARERLQILLEFDRGTGRSDLLAILRDEIVAVITKHFTTDEDKIQIRIDRGNDISTVAVEVEVPTKKLLSVLA